MNLENVNNDGLYMLVGLGVSGIIFAAYFIWGWLSRKDSDSPEAHAIFPEKLRRLAVQEGDISRKSEMSSGDGVLPMTLAFGAGYSSNMDPYKMNSNSTQGEVHSNPENSSHSSDGYRGGGDSHDSSGANSDSSSVDGGGGL